MRARRGRPRRRPNPWLRTKGRGRVRVVGRRRAPWDPLPPGAPSGFLHGVVLADVVRPELPVVAERAEPVPPLRQHPCRRSRAGPGAHHAVAVAVAVSVLEFFSSTNFPDLPVKQIVLVIR